MIIYLIAFAISLIFYYLSQITKQNKAQKAFMILSCLPFFIIPAIRYNVGIDTWLNYAPTFLNVAKNGHTFNVFPFLMKKYEIGFSFIVFILSKISTNPTILFAVCSAIITFFTFATIYQESKIPWLSIAIFFLSGAFLLSMNGMRNYVAMAIILFSLKYIHQKKLWKFLIFVAIAASIHKSVLLFIILYPIYNLKINYKQLIAILVVGILLTFGINDILYFLLQNTSYANYFITDKKFVDPLYTMLIINATLLGIFLINYKTYKDDYKYNFYLKLQLLSLIICIFSFKLSSAYRLEQIVDFLQIITIPYNIHLLFQNTKIKRNISIVILTFVIAMFGAYFCKAFILSDDNQVNNYRTIFNKEG